MSHVCDKNLGPQRVEIFLDLPGSGPFVNLTLETVFGAFFIDSPLQPFEASAENCVLAR